MQIIDFSCKKKWFKHWQVPPSPDNFLVKAYSSQKEVSVTTFCNCLSEDYYALQCKLVIKWGFGSVIANYVGCIEKDYQ